MLRISAAVILWLAALLYTSTFSITTAYAGGIDTTLEKDKTGGWTVSYSASKPIKRIAFSRNPDDSRVKRWNLVGNDLKIVFEDSQEYIVSKTGALFESATLNLTTSYKHLSKDYAPFSPFSDGGTLVHSGRFFACENSCADDLNQWAMSLIVPKEDLIIINGQIVESTISWADNSDGRNIYVGSQQPDLSGGFITVIDQGLPDEIKASLQTDIPKMMDHLEAKLGKLNTKQRPSLFASYAKVGGTSTQGGALPNQFFIHWNRDDLEEQVGSQTFINDLLWTFAHESGHFYQQFEKMVPKRKDSWIHEGHAEMLAFDTLQHLYPESLDYLKAKIEHFKLQCAKGLSETSLNEAAQNGKFYLYYSCGFLIHQAIENAIEKDSGREHSAYRIWNRFRENESKVEEKGKDSFLNTVAELVNKELAERISFFVETEDQDPISAMENLTNIGESKKLVRSERNK